MLSPLYEHNLEEWNRLLRLKRVTAVVGVLAVLPLALLVPADFVLPAVMGLFFVMAAMFGVLDIKRILVFRRDLREQKQRANGDNGEATGGLSE